MEAELLPFTNALPEKAPALRLARTLAAKTESELRAIKLNNPLLFAAWIEELSRWRRRSENDVELLRETERVLRKAGQFVDQDWAV